MAGPLFAGLRPNRRHPKKLLIIHQSLVVTFGQLCAKSADAPALEELGPRYGVTCGHDAGDAEGILQLVGHGIYSRQVCGLLETVCIVFWIRRFLCFGVRSHDEPVAGLAAPLAPADAHYYEDRHRDDHDSHDSHHGRKQRSWLGEIFD